jgi:hypothetical protein
MITRITFRLFTGGATGRKDRAVVREKHEERGPQIWNAGLGEMMVAMTLLRQPKLLSRLFERAICSPRRTPT